MKSKLVLSYDGTPFAGWQVQPNGTSIQELLERAISCLLRSNTKVIGSGRTDAGVHALAQVAHFSHAQPLPPRFLRSCNALLPPQIRVHSVELVAEDFHARYDAYGKIYHYHLWCEPIHSPFHRLYSLHYPYPFDQQAAQEAANLLLGTHNFSSFANAAHEGAAGKNPVRTLKRLQLVEQEGGLRFEFEADGFLYKMVRNLTAALLEVGSGKSKSSTPHQILLSQNRRLAPAPAPPHPLFLIRVLYLT
ncbi:MAG: tRNA pseudouridine(38-40) synthase TruA [Verrucomicrobia bacterium]|nr:tRNA pseudouridine(38-40) synthase TruA [Verrucomicrobiota bacterium]